jgi:anti-sigma factor RsiW
MSTGTDNNIAGGMNCDEARTLLPAYGDGELDLPRTLAMEQHLEGCAECGAALRSQRALRQAVRSVPYHRASEALRARLRAQLPGLPEAQAPATPQLAATAASVTLPVSAATSRRRRDWSRWAMPIAASLALAVGLNLMLASQRAGDALRDELIAGHVRSLQAEHLSDVVSTDQHTVKPWFNGKLDYAPPVRDLAQHDFPLVGGRLDYIEHRQVAALIYRSRKHAINLYVWPAVDGELAPQRQGNQGYNLVHWRHQGMEYWAVSDLNAQELQKFADLQIAATSEPAANAPNT